MSLYAAEVSRSEPNPRTRRCDFALRACVDRQRSLSSTWDLFGLFGVPTETHYISLAFAGVAEELETLVNVGQSNREVDAIDRIHGRLHALESEMRALTRDVSLEQIRSCLPAQVRKDRRSVLDLLDIMLSDDGAAARSSTVDYVITLLCIDGGDAIAIQDPVTLTPRLFGLCERASSFLDPRVSEIQAEYIAGLHDPNPNAMLHRKSDLGDVYFVPQVLRAVIDFNAAQWWRASSAASKEAAGERAVEESYESDATSSVFNTSLLPALAEALRRRLSDAAQDATAIDRIAWSVDLGYLSTSERMALCSPAVATAEDATGTAILVGLLCNSAAVIAEELEMIGVSIARMKGEWTQELSHALKREIDALVASDHYDAAGTLSELRTKYLYEPVADTQPRLRPTPPAPEAESQGREFLDAARELASQAVAEGQSARKADAVAQGFLSRGKIVRGVGILVMFVGVGLQVLQALYPSDGLSRLDRDAVEAVSRFLADGRRSAGGTGSAFVGTIEEDWLELGTSSKQQAANEIVEALRSQGVREIMIYDRDDILRIQALGRQPASVFAGGKD